MKHQFGEAERVNNPDRNFVIRTTGKVAQAHHSAARKLTLVCEGGGQRGIFTAGILDSFMQQNFFPFQSLLGVSAGAQNLMSYACNQYGYAREAIAQFTTSRHFYNPMRFARGGHLIDLDWYFSALNQEMPLDIQRGQKRLAGRSFHLCASRRDNLVANYLPFQTDNVALSLKASCAMPLFYRQGVELNGVDYWDGGVADSLPVQAAYNTGSDCIVVIRTQPRESLYALNRLPKNWRLQRLKKLGSVVESYVKNYNAAMAFIDHPPLSLNVIDIAPAKPLKSRMLGSSQDMLHHDYQLGQLCGRDFLEKHAWRL